MRGRQCTAPVTGRAASAPASRDRARPAPVAPWLPMSNVLDAATSLPSSPLSRLGKSPCKRPPTGYGHRACGASSAPIPPVLPPRNRDRPCGRLFPASQGHEPRHQRCHGSCAYPPAVSCSLRASAVMRTRNTTSGTEHATALRLRSEATAAQAGSGTPQSGVSIYSNDVRLLSSIARLTSDGGSPNIGGASAPGQSRL